MWPVLVAQFELFPGLTIPPLWSHLAVMAAAAWLTRAACSRFPGLLAKTPQQILQELLDQQKKNQG